MDDPTPSTSFGWQAPTPAELAGVLSNYEVTALLGQGGMGAVYRALQPNLDRDVAIKILPMDLAIASEGLQFAERFEQEAKSMARLSHPGIIKVYDFGEAEFSGGKFLYFVMEFVQGQDIHQYLHKQGGRLDIESSHAIICHVLDALGFAHQHGIIHRDIKPANIMLDQHGRVKVADFGLAKSTGQDMGLTMTNMAMGTADYVAPEVLEEGREVDGRVDLYAVGAMFYQLLTGQVPRGVFRPASKLVEGLDPRYDEIIGKALQPDPEDRYKDAREFRVALDRVMAGPPSEAVAMKKTRLVTTKASGAEAAAVPLVVEADSGGGKVKWIAGAAALLAVAVGGILMVAGGPESEEAGESGEGAPSAVVQQGPSEEKGQQEQQQQQQEQEQEQEQEREREREQQEKEMPVANVAESTAEWSVENSLGMRFVPVEITGGPTDTATSGKEVLVSIWETRRRDYQAFVEATGREWFGTVARTQEEGWNETPDHPAGQLSWEDAVAFCAWLTEKEHKTGAIPEGAVYRLPTDHEWSCAAGIGKEEDPAALPEDKHMKRQSYPWGAAWPPPAGAGNYLGEESSALVESSWEPIAGYSDGFSRTAPVGSFEANARGLYDLGGNMLEFCQEESQPGRRVARGACWLVFKPEQVTVSHRRGTVQSSPIRGGHVGFRCVLELPAGADLLARGEGDPSGGQQPEPQPLPPAAEVEEKSVPSVEEKSTPAPALTPALSAIPGLRGRLEAYLSARRKQVSDLADKYGRAVEVRLNQAADAGDLKLATAYREEKASIAALRKNLAVKPEDPTAAVWEPLDLPSPPAGSPELLVSLREVWGGEIAKIDGQLGPALGRSLQILEGELTRSRNFEEARRLVAFREALTSRDRKSAAANAGETGSSSEKSSSAGKSSTVGESPSVPGEWASLFNGASLDGWTVSGDKRSFSIDGSAIKLSGNPGYLYYSGDVAGGVQFRDFDFQAEVQTSRGATGGVFFHTLNTGSGFPERGYEVKINNTVGGDSEKTGSLSEVKKLEQSPVADNQWFKLEISVRGMEVVVRINGKEVLTHIEPENFRPPSEISGRFIREGSFALRCNFTPEGSVMFRNIVVRPYMDALTVACRLKPGTRIERSPPDLRALAKGRLFAWGLDGDGNQIDLGDLDRGNDFVRVHVKKDGYWYALRARGAIVTNHSEHSRHEDGIALFSLTGGHGWPVMLWRDGRLRKEDRMRFPPDVEQGTFVDGAGGGYEYFAFLDNEGRVGSDVGDRWDWGMRLPPVGRTDIVALAFGHKTCWCLRANGQLVWFGEPPRMELSEQQNQNIVAVEASPNSGHVLALTADGRVYSWSSREEELGALEVVEAARTGMQAIRVSNTDRAGISAARGRDGKWVAWGNDQDGVVSKINSLTSKVQDVAFSERLLLWIE